MITKAKHICFFYNFHMPKKMSQNNEVHSTYSDLHCSIYVEVGNGSNRNSW